MLFAVFLYQSIQIQAALQIVQRIQMQQIIAPLSRSALMIGVGVCGIWGNLHIGPVHCQEAVPLQRSTRRQSARKLSEQMLHCFRQQLVTLLYKGRCGNGIRSILEEIQQFPG